MPVLPTPDRLDSAEARRDRRCVHDLCRTGLGGATTYVAIPIRSASRCEQPDTIRAVQPSAARGKSAGCVPWPQPTASRRMLLLVANAVVRRGACKARRSSGAVGGDRSCRAL
jgi:hypothetical protein